MERRNGPSRERGAVLSTLEETGCLYCEDGELTRTTYKGNDAVVCVECGTPRAQLW